MRKSRFLSGGLLLGLQLGWCAIAGAAEPAKAAPKMTPEQEKAMAAYAKAATPGAEHARLQAWVGTWDMEVTSYDGPTPQKSKGTAVFAAVLGGREVTQSVHAEMAGMPFEGWSIEGYDNVAKKYWSTWTDSMSTGPTTSWGTCDAAGACSYEGSYNDPLTGRATKVRMTSKPAGADRFDFSFYGPGPDGKEAKMMEIAYTRHK